jgi:antitoxin (DNA-binding transcriptional repressor) of toxin-antitoxin stability system
MTAVGSYQAKTHLPELLERVAQGEKILITRRGLPVAMLTQPPQQVARDVRQVVADMLSYRDRQKRTLGKLTARDMIEQGRRF